MKNRVELEAVYLLLNTPPVINARNTEELKRELGDLTNIFNITEQDINNLAISNKTKEKLIAKCHKIDKDKLVEKLENLSASILLYEDERYPQQLRNLFTPPVMLFCKGNIELLKEARIIAIVGTRKSSGYGEKLAANFVKSIALNKHTIITGTAFGIDSTVISCAIKHKANCISVLASGIDEISPSKSRELLDNLIANGGCVITEFPPGVSSFKSNYPIRAKLLAALSNDIVLIEVPEKSGALLVGQEGFLLDKPVYCPTSYIYDSNFYGSHKLIEEGKATLARNFEDIKAKLNIKLAN